MRGVSTSFGICSLTIVSFAFRRIGGSKWRISRHWMGYWSIYGIWASRPTCRRSCNSKAFSSQPTRKCPLALCVTAKRRTPTCSAASKRRPSGERHKRSRRDKHVRWSSSKRKQAKTASLLGGFFLCQRLFVASSLLQSPRSRPCYFAEPGRIDRYFGKMGFYTLCPSDSRRVSHEGKNWDQGEQNIRHGPRQVF